MSRIPLNAESFSELKLTLSNSFKILNTLFWCVAFDDHAKEFSIIRDSKDTEFKIEPFKPQNGLMNFYNSIAQILGYSNWKELESVSSSNSEIYNALFLNSDFDLKMAIKNIYLDNFKTQYKNSNSTITEKFSHILDIILGGIVINCNDKEAQVLYTNQNRTITLTPRKLIFTNGNVTETEIDTGFSTLTPFVTPFIHCTHLYGCNETRRTSENILINSSVHQEGSCIELLYKHMCLAQSGNTVFFMKGEVGFEADKQIPSTYAGVILLANIILAHYDIYHSSHKTYSEYLDYMLKPRKKDELIRELNELGYIDSH